MMRTSALQDFYRSDASYAGSDLGTSPALWRPRKAASRITVRTWDAWQGARERTGYAPGFAPGSAEVALGSTLTGHSLCALSAVRDNQRNVVLLFVWIEMLNFINN
jgi:hypothetical protein